MLEGAEDKRSIYVFVRDEDKVKVFELCEICADDLSFGNEMHKGRTKSEKEITRSRKRPKMESATIDNNEIKEQGSDADLMEEVHPPHKKTGHKQVRSKDVPKMINTKGTSW